MKTIVNILTVSLMFLLVSGCKQEYFPPDQLSDEQVRSSPELLSNLTVGTYSRLREPNYVRLRHFIQELPGDELLWSKSSGDNLANAYNYNRLVNSASSLNFWNQAYYGIFQANKVIEAIEDNAPQNKLQLKGENLFLRALMHYDLIRIFGRPYSQSPDKNLGVMIKENSAMNDLPGRSTVKETYEFIVKDLLRAAELMKENKANVFASKEVAWALLARVYLYMDQNDKALEYADKVINSGRYKLVTTAQLSKYYTTSPEANSETIFAIKYQTSENPGKASIGSLYTRDGWGEILVTKNYRQLIYKNPNDERIKFLDPDYVLDASGNKIPDAIEESGFRVNKAMGYSRYFNLKYTLQDNVLMLSSPVVLRLAEMYLIKAEAYAKMPGKEGEALQMVNVIRSRAGLSAGQLYTIDDLKGYATVLDVVLAERNLELAWEGHRSFDLFRNNRSLDRSFTQSEGWSGPRMIEPTSNLIVAYIPEVEINLNPKLIQNP
ncbi:MAG: RagB/SusD family nutrient uptake outer membrane protein [Segetibacter sp.]|nr:RagB/SusD family nutrient uptake outer membrane protein [Segetibacter sp.]